MLKLSTGIDYSCPCDSCNTAKETEVENVESIEEQEEVLTPVDDQDEKDEAEFIFEAAAVPALGLLALKVLPMKRTT